MALDRQTAWWVTRRSACAAMQATTARTANPPYELPRTWHRLTNPHASTHNWYIAKFNGLARLFKRGAAGGKDFRQGRYAGAEQAFDRLLLVQCGIFGELFAGGLPISEQHKTLHRLLA